MNAFPVQIHERTASWGSDESCLSSEGAVPWFRVCTKKCDAVLYKTMHFNDIFDYHSHISENNITTVRWFLLTVSLIVPHLGLFFLHSCRLTGVALDLGWKTTYMRLYGRCDLIFWFPENINIYLIVLRVVLSHTICIHQKCSPLFLLQSRKARVPNYWPNILL